MNGTNSLSETDKAPLRLCSECQEKLYWNFHFDNKKRLAQLSACCAQYGLQQDLEIFRRDQDVVQ
jgi:archaemetzincin